jgi:hypothetical protein
LLHRERGEDVVHLSSERRLRPSCAEVDLESDAAFSVAERTFNDSVAARDATRLAEVVERDRWGSVAARLVADDRDKDVAGAHGQDRVLSAWREFARRLETLVGRKLEVGDLEDDAP